MTTLQWLRSFIQFSTSNQRPSESDIGLTFVLINSIEIATIAILFLLLCKINQPGPNFIMEAYSNYNKNQANHLLVSSLTRVL